MQVNSDTSTSKRPKAKAKSKDAAATTTTRKPRKARTAAKPEPVAVVQPIDMGSMIATAAYYLAEERNFAPGHEVDDWLEAERRMRSMHG